MASGTREQVTPAVAAGAPSSAGRPGADSAWRAAGLANLGLRFLVELAAYASLGYGGAAVGGPPARRALVAAAAVLLALGLWTAFLAPKGRRRLGDPAALALELAIFAAAAAALASTGRVAPAVVLAAVAAANAIGVRLFGVQAPGMAVDVPSVSR